MRQNLKLTLKGLGSTTAGLWRGWVLLSFVFCGCVTAAAQTTENVELVSVNGAGGHAGNGRSAAPRVSADGRFVVFESSAGDLIANDTNGSTSDIFVRDLQQQTTMLVSVNAAGTASGNGASSAASITPDGRFVVFESDASDLVAGDANGTKDVFARDLVAQTTTLASVNAAGAGSGGGSSSGGLITPDGRFVVFTSIAGDLVTGDTNQRGDVFRRDLLTGSTVLVSVNTVGANGGDGNSSATAVTPDGRYVLFASAATDLAANDTNGSLQDYFRRDLQTNATALASVNSAGTGSGNAAASDAVMSDDGQVVAFSSSATDLVPPGGENTGFTSPSIYARDFAAGTTTLVSERQVFQASIGTVPPASLPRISGDGRYVFYVRRDNFFSFGRIHDMIFRRDRQTGDLLQLPFVPVAEGTCDQGFNCRSTVTALTTSPDGRYVAYGQQQSPRSNNPPVSTGIVIHDMVGGGTATVLGTRGFTPTTNSHVMTVGNVGGGGKVAFSSGVSHAAQDANGLEDVYLFSLPQPSLAFSAASYSASEAAGGVAFTVTLLGNPSGTVSVDYATSGGSAGERSDYITAAGRLTFAPGETSKTFRVLVVDDNFVEGDETVNVSLSNPKGTGAGLGNPLTAELRIVDDDTSPPTTNPSDGARFFVRQHYLDFLNREPDPSGLDFWTNEIESCGADAQCREVKRINVSAAFFLSIEFQRTGVLAYLTNKAAFGPSVGGSPAPVLFGQFIREVQQLQQNLVFGWPDFDAQLEMNKQEYFAAVVARPEFVAAFATTLTPGQFVDALFANAGITPTTSERAAAVSEFGSATNTTDQAARARALRRVAENTAFAQAEFNRSFVTMEYFGYLRRDPDAAGFNFWLGKLEQFGGDFIRAEMVKAFIGSGEYRQRFGP